MQFGEIKPSHPGLFAASAPDRPAVTIAESGKRLSYAQFEAISNQFAHLLRRAGLARGERVAMLMENHLFYMAFAWGAFRSGLRLVAIATHLSPEEVGYILENTGARLLVTSCALAKTVECLKMAGVDASRRLVVGGGREGFIDIERVLGTFPSGPITDQSEGVEVLY